MRFAMKQKMLAFGDDYIVKNDEGDDVYYIDGKVFTIRDSLDIQDMEGNTVATIRKRLLALRRTYDIDIGGRVTTVYKHMLTFFRCSYTVDVPGPDDLQAQGNFFEYEYTFTNDAGDKVGEVSKRWLTIRDTYTIDVADGVDPVMIIASAVVIDQCCHEERH